MSVPTDAAVAAPTDSGLRREGLSVAVTREESLVDLGEGGEEEFEGGGFRLGGGGAMAEDVSSGLASLEEVGSSGDEAGIGGEGGRWIDSR